MASSATNIAGYQRTEARLPQLVPVCVRQPDDIRDRKDQGEEDVNIPRMQYQLRAYLDFAQRTLTFLLCVSLFPAPLVPCPETEGGQGHGGQNTPENGKSGRISCETVQAYDKAGTYCHVFGTSRLPSPPYRPLPSLVPPFLLPPQIRIGIHCMAPHCVQSLDTWEK